MDDVKNLAVFLDIWAPDIDNKNGDCRRAFEVNLTKLVSEYHTDRLFFSIFESDTVEAAKKAIENILKDDQTFCDELMLFSGNTTSNAVEIIYDKLMSYNNIWLNVRYIAFYGFVIFHRRRLDYKSVDKKLTEHCYRFSEFSSFNHLLVMHEIDRPKHKDVNYAAMIENLNMANENIKKYKCIPEDGEPVNLIGVKHAFADLFATYCEHSPSYKNDLLEKWGNIAENAIDDIVRADETYAKYHCTYGRILAQKCQYKEALRQIDKAIDIEDSNLSDAEYSLRIIQYQSYRIQIQAHFELEELKKKQSEINKEIDGVKSSLVSNVEIIGFFSGIISFIIASINLLENMSATDAGMLMVVLLGALLTAFGCFSLLLNSGKNKMFKIIVISTGIGLILLGGVTIICFATLTALLPPV